MADNHSKNARRMWAKELAAWSGLAKAKEVFFQFNPREFLKMSDFAYAKALPSLTGRLPDIARAHGLKSSGRDYRHYSSAANMRKRIRPASDPRTIDPPTKPGSKPDVQNDNYNDNEDTQNMNEDYRLVSDLAKDIGVDELTTMSALRLAITNQIGNVINTERAVPPRGTVVEETTTIVIGQLSQYVNYDPAGAYYCGTVVGNLLPGQRVKSLYPATYDNDTWLDTSTDAFDATKATGQDWKTRYADQDGTVFIPAGWTSGVIGIIVPNANATVEHSIFPSLKDALVAGEDHFGNPIKPNKAAWSSSAHSPAAKHLKS